MTFRPGRVMLKVIRWISVKVGAVPDGHANAMAACRSFDVVRALRAIRALSAHVG
jgi:hypothetical protein